MATPPDLVLTVHMDDDRKALSYTAKTHGLRHGLNYQTYPPVPLRRNPLEYFKEVCEIIQVESRLESEAQVESRLESETRLESLGLRLFETLIPSDLRRWLWSHYRNIKSVQIVSEGVRILWELLKLRDPDADDASYDTDSIGPFFGEIFAITRWLAGAQEVSEIPLRQVALVVSEESQLPSAIREVECLKSLLKGAGREGERIPACHGTVIKTLGSGRYGGWHFAGRGREPDEDHIRRGIALDKYRTLRLDDLSGRARKLGRAHPLVFLNVCFSGRGTPSLTEFDGLAPAFLRAGAGAVIGSYWEVDDDLAKSFAEGFYQHFLVDGLPIGEAARRARLRIREKCRGNPVWLAYTVFAHPLAMAEGSAPPPDPPGPEPPRPGPEPPRPGPEPPRPEEPRLGQMHLHEKDGTVLVHVPGGEFNLGADDAGEVNGPVHRVCLSAFWIGKYPVTNEQYRRFLEANPDRRPPERWDDRNFNQPRQPVVGVSWEDADAYCRWAGLVLPTEAQWEAAARGRDERPYPWGSEPSTPERANFAREVGKGKRPTPVDSHPRGAGPYGTFDQAGNVWEWCADHWDPTAYGLRDGQRDPVAVGAPSRRVVRGGSWDSPGSELRATCRNGHVASESSMFCGFRCALNTPI